MSENSGERPRRVPIVRVEEHEVRLPYSDRVWKMFVREVGDAVLVSAVPAKNA